MKILVVFTGGTIGSFYDGEYISTDKGKPCKLLEMYNTMFVNDINWDTESPYTILSENLDGSILIRLAECVQEALKKDYDGIIVTLGSDTLQYSAAFLSYVLGMDTVPVVLVAANYVPEDKRSNGLKNFAGAVDFIAGRGGRGVFVSYANAGEKCLIHRGTRLMSHVAYSDYLYSLDGKNYGTVSEGKFTENAGYNEVFNSYSYRIVDNSGAESGVLWIKEHPGMLLPHFDDRIKTVLISAYHSGTIYTGSDVFREWSEEAKRRKLPVYLVGQTEGPDYETCRVYKELGIKVLPCMSPVAAYVRLWLENISECRYGMSASISGDIMPVM